MIVFSPANFAEKWAGLIQICEGYLILGSETDF